MQHLLSVLKLSNTIIQEDYYLLRANDMLDINMRENLEQLKRLGRGRRDIKFASEFEPLDSGDAKSSQGPSAGHQRGVLTTASGATIALNGVVNGGGGAEADAMDRFNITMADHGVENAADDDDDDDGGGGVGDDKDEDDYETIADEAPDAVQRHDVTISIAPAAPANSSKRRSRSSMNDATGATNGAEPIAKRPAKKLFKADSFNVRNNVMGKSSAAAFASSSTSASALRGVLPPLPPRATVHATSVAALRAQCNLRSYDSDGDDRMDVDVMAPPPSSSSGESSTAMARNQQTVVKAKSTLLRSILKDNAASTLYQKGEDILEYYTYGKFSLFM